MFDRFGFVMVSDNFFMTPDIWWVKIQPMNSSKFVHRRPKIRSFINRVRDVCHLKIFVLGFGFTTIAVKILLFKS